VVLALANSRSEPGRLREWEEIPPRGNAAHCFSARLPPHNKIKLPEFRQPLASWKLVWSFPSFEKADDRAHERHRGTPEWCHTLWLRFGP